MVLRSKFVKAGAFRTLESFWNVTTTGFFRAPNGSEIKIYYGYGWLGKSRQRQKLDGRTVMALRVSKWSAAGARMQIKVPRDSEVEYSVAHGDVGFNLPEIEYP